MSNSSNQARAITRSRVTQADVAREAGVSISVVSRALAGDPALRARPETRARIQEAADTLGYTPSHAARALRLSRAFAVGLIVPELTNPIYDQLIRGVEETADGLGYQVLMGRVERVEPGTDFLTRLAREGRADGFLVQRRDATEARDFWPLIEAAGRPVVLINSRGRRRGSVVHDDVSGARIATEHLLALGHRAIAFVGGDSRSHTSSAREAGYLKAIRAAGMRKRSDWILHQRYEPEAGRAAVRDLCTTGRRRPTAMVVANAMEAIGVLRGAREIGLKVPDQLSVVAIHDWWAADYLRPALTTVRLPQYQLGQEAMHLLHRQLEGGTAEDITIVDPPPQLIERESTAPAPRRIIRAQLPATQPCPA